MKLCKNYMIYLINKTNVKADGTVTLTSGGSITSIFYATLEAAQAAADAQARAGYVAVIYESTEFRQVQPMPIVIEKTSCC